MRAFRAFVLALWALAALVPAARAQDLGLYQGRAIVTGQGAENREIGFALALEDVLVKVSGDPALIGNPQAARLAADAGSLVTGFTYRDLLEGIPVHDEQGTYARPHFLTVTFDPARIDRALVGLGRKPWTAQRPRTLVLLGVRNATADFVLADDADQGSYMREALQAAGVKLGIPVVLPNSADIAGRKLSLAAIDGMAPADIQSLRAAGGQDALLLGTLAWSDADLGWVARWRLVMPDGTVEWRRAGLGFDDAFRQAMRGVAQVASGNGTP